MNLRAVRVGLGLTAVFGVMFLTAALAQAAEPLPALGASTARLSVSGISSGAYMAVQMQVAHAAAIRGVGVIAGGPFECAEGTVSRALRNCMAPTAGAPPPTPQHTIKRVQARAAAGQIDSPEALGDDRVWVFSGANDRTVEPAVVDALVAFYRLHLPDEAIAFITHPRAGHAMPSIVAASANACETSEPPFINVCEGMDAAGELLQHLLATRAARAAPKGRLLTFDQAPFADGRPFDISLADQGHVYVPPGCEAGGCELHIAFHGCLQTEAHIGRRFIEGAGYNEWADDLRLIVLYPQIAARSGPAFGSWRWVMNPKGCWDWWGYTGPDYATREGAQIKAVWAMVEQLKR